MISFWITGYRLLKVLVSGLRDDAEVRVLIFFLFTVLLSGTIFYHFTEGWSVIDSLYFCVMLMATIGLSDLSPTMEVSKIFTMIYAVLSIGVFITLCSKLVLIMVSTNLKTAEKISGKLAGRSTKSPERSGD